MSEAWWPLLVTAAAMALLRGVGLALAWRLDARHPAIAWAAAVSEAALAAWVVLAMVTPGGPWSVTARLAALAVAVGVFAAAGRRLLPALAAGLAVAALLR
ncbi:hypothetical protein [Muricoccus radiodurans]|uniref:hypothetical protein n=1 Tax=Muricoccus radiodurans TaxID=2231721 RepID=UPI003CEB5360